MRPETAIAQLRHLYKQMVSGEVKFIAMAATGLLGPAIESLEPAVAELATLRTTVEELRAENEKLKAAIPEDLCPVCDGERRIWNVVLDLSTDCGNCAGTGRVKP